MKRNKNIIVEHVGWPTVRTRIRFNGGRFRYTVVIEHGKLLYVAERPRGLK